MNAVPKLFAALLASTLVAACTADVSVDDNTPTPPVPTSEAAQTNAVETAFNYFVSKGLTEEQAAGIVGNLMQESSVNPNSVQYGGGPGRGIAQWSIGGRWDQSAHDNVASFASGEGLSRWSLNAQLDFIWYELTNIGYGYSSLQAATTVTDATIAFENRYEICGACDEAKRIGYANQVLADYGTGTDGGTGTGTGTGGGGTDGTGGTGDTGGASCYSGTLGQDVPENTCVQSVYDGQWYQCDNGSWVDRWSDPQACNGEYPL